MRQITTTIVAALLVCAALSASAQAGWRDWGGSGGYSSAYSSGGWQNGWTPGWNWNNGGSTYRGYGYSYSDGCSRRDASVSGQSATTRQPTGKATKPAAYEARKTVPAK